MNDNLTMKISVIIPMYNEEKIIGSTAETLHDTLTRDFGAGEFEVIFVSDGSSDGCAQIVRKYTRLLPELKLIEYLPNRGKGCAVRKGMLAGMGDFVLFTDSDLAYGADIIKTVYDRFVQTGADVIIGSRAIKGGGYDSYTFFRKVMSKTYLKVISIAAGFSHSDSQAGLKGFSRDAAQKIFKNCTVDRFAFDLEALLIADKMGCSIEEIPANVLVHGDSKVSAVRDALNMLGQLRKIKKRVKKLEI